MRMPVTAPLASIHYHFYAIGGHKVAREGDLITIRYH